jgi:WD40 repeat protein
LWDDKRQQILYELEFSAPVKAIRTCKNRLIVILITKVVVYQLFPVKKMYEFDMFWNEHAIFDISKNESNIRILAFPARQKGQVQVVEIEGGWSNSPLVPFTSRIAGHSTGITSISVSDDGSYIATTSQNGTLIRVWHSHSGTLKHELRRGVDYADIYSLSFDPCNTKLCLVSDKNTMHVFSLRDEPTSSSKSNSVLSPFPYLPKYFSSDWSFCSCSIPDLSRSIVKIVPTTTHPMLYTTILLLGSDGTLGSFVFDSKEDGLIRKTYYKFYKS